MSVDRACRDHRLRGTAFVGAHARDVAYASDLLGAVAGSLDLRVRAREERERARRIEKRRRRRRRARQGRRRRKRRRKRRPVLEERERAREEHQRKVLLKYLEALRMFLPPLMVHEKEEKDPKEEERLVEYLRELEAFAETWSSSSTASSSFLQDFLFVESSLRRRLRPFNEVENGRDLHGVEGWRWMGCRDGGYPCALWQLFHVLTVEQAHRWRWGRIHQVRTLSLFLEQ